MNESGNHLVQIQNDAFIFNWRLIDASDVYPEHKAILERFSGLWKQFVGFVSDHGAVEPRVVEWTYVDKLDLSKPSNNLIRFVDEALGTLPGEAFSLSFQVARELRVGDRSEGFVSVFGSPGIVQASGEQIFALNISTKLDASGTDATNASDLLLRAHDISFQAFTSVYPDYRPTIGAQ